MRKKIRVVGAVALLFFSVHTLGWAFTSIPQAQDEAELLVTQAREMIGQGHFQEAVTVLQRLLPQVVDKNRQAQIRLLLGQTYLSAGDTGACEESLRAIFDNRLNRHVDPAEMGEDLRLVYEKIKAEYWYVSGSMESVEEKRTGRVIARPAKKPKKRRMWPTLLAGALVLGVIVALVVILAGGKQDDPGEERAGLLFENTHLLPVRVEISDIGMNVPGRTTLFIPLDPGSYILYVFLISYVYTYSIVILEGTQIHFQFPPSSD